jgi:hypothetical protein
MPVILPEALLRHYFDAPDWSKWPYIFAESSFAMSIPRTVNRIESEISPRSFSRLSERLSDVRAAFAFSGPAVALSITSHLCP